MVLLRDFSCWATVNFKVKYPVRIYYNYEVTSQQVFYKYAVRVPLQKSENVVNVTLCGMVGVLGRLIAVEKEMHVPTLSIAEHQKINYIMKLHGDTGKTFYHINLPQGLVK